MMNILIIDDEQVIRQGVYNQLMEMELSINEIKFYGFCAEDTKQKERNTVDKETLNRYNN